MTNLVIVESAAKAKTIQKYLNSSAQLADKGSFNVMASFGHITDLPSKDLGVDKNTWKATYVQLDAKKDVIKKLQSAINKADVVYLASDLDLEGEAIAQHLLDTLSIRKKKHYRITFNEITKSALENAVLHPRRIDDKMVDAQEARRILDRVVGYELSPLLWKRFATARLSAGRVQSAALKILVDRSLEHKNHVPTAYWTINGTFKLSQVATELHAKMYDEDAIKVWDNETQLMHTLKAIQKSWDAKWVISFTRKESKRSPSAPFVTSSLQQEAYSRLGLSAKRTMQIAQSLYEDGFITYMRTDSTSLSSEAQNSILQYVTDEFGIRYAQHRTFRNKNQHAQEAHECIRPTNCKVTSTNTSLEGINKKLYDLIWRRAVASQMTSAKFADIIYDIVATGLSHRFCGKHSVLIEEGFLKVYAPEQRVATTELARWEDMTDNQHIRPIHVSADGDATKPRGMFNEPSLIKYLEKSGIGRPSTYATIIDKLFHKGYVVKGSVAQNTINVTSFHTDGSNHIVRSEGVVDIGGSGSDYLVPSGLGENVVEYLSQVVPEVLDTDFTAKLELDLDAISEGTKTKNGVLSSFYKPFRTLVDAADQQQVPKKQKKPKEDTRPQNVIRDFDRIHVQVVQTRYGPALYDVREKRFASLTPLLSWRNKSIEDLTEKEVKFVMRLPLKFDDTTREVHIGRYGLYLKDVSTNTNIRLPKEMWDQAFEGVLASKDVQKIK